MSSLAGVRQRIGRAAPSAARAWRRFTRRVHGMLGDKEFARHALVGPGRFWREKRAWQMAFLKERGELLPAHRFLDIGCGTLRGGIPIIEFLEPEHYWGLEVRPHVLEEAHKELALHPEAKAKRPTLLLSEGFALLPDLAPIDRAWGFSVLIHMEDPIAKDCFDYVGRVLAPAGMFLANVGLGVRSDAVGGAGFPVVTRPLDFYRELADAVGLEVHDMGTLKSLGHEFGLSGDSNHMLRFSRPR